MRYVLFYRDVQRFNGGHLKVWDYYNHVCHAPGYAPLVHFSPRTVWDEQNLWRHLKDDAHVAGAGVRPDVLFLSASDWRSIDPGTTR